MNKLEKALNELVNVHNKFNLQGKFEERYGIEQEWPDYINKFDDILFLFEKFSPVDMVIETGFTPIKFW
ncbi:hypothetical protein [Xenorhabdus japonica]|uniref:Uncharacterized protein n=1 Tax=Xenorhabdus japonica TaxID=53341 RepID=A0A1I5D7T9_9GAMM|nr:hypothetical protein [Xenorhabdus japonica]SFN95176.1 hypothetical protein SAMN05421579_1363 [Xenorhabdus japonica]